MVTSKTYHKIATTSFPGIRWTVSAFPYSIGWGIRRSIDDAGDIIMVKNNHIKVYLGALKIADKQTNPY